MALLPVLDVELDADVAGDGDHVRRTVGRAPGRGGHRDRVLERLPRHDLRGLEVLPDHLDDPLARQIGHLRPLAIRCGDRGAAGERHAQRLGHGVHGRGRAHRVAVADRWCRRAGHLHELLDVDLALGEELAGVPDDRPGAGEAALVVAVQHRPAREDDGRDIDGGGGHDERRRGLVAARRQHDTVDRVAVQDLDTGEVLKIAVEHRRRPLARLLDRMDRELDRDASHVADAGAHAVGEIEMVAVAGCQVGARLGDADDRPARLQLLAGETVVEIALEIERRHVDVGVVEPPVLRPEPPFRLVSHTKSSPNLKRRRALSTPECRGRQARPRQGPWSRDRGTRLPL